MQSSAISLSLSIPLIKSRRNPSRDFTTVKLFDPFHASASSHSKRLTVANSSGENSSFNSTQGSPFSLSFDGFFSKPAVILGKRSDDDSVAVRATAVPETAGEVPKASSIGRTLELVFLLAMWYLFNIYFNIYNKQVLEVFPYPWTMSMFQFSIGSVIVLFMWTFNIYKKPKFSATQLAAIMPLAIVHTLGTIFTIMSLGKVAVSFTHTIKAMEPFFTVLLSTLFLGETPTPWVLFSLLPIVGGVALASATEASFNWAGFWSAMASNLTNQSRNVFSKELLVKEEESLDNINLFSIITIMSFILLAPATIFMEGIKFTPAYLEAAGLNAHQVLSRSFLAALCFHAYQQVAYMILQRVSPVTHSVANCVKRVVVIVSSVIFFRTQVSPINALGTGIALAGVFLYSRVKRIKAKPKTT